MIEEILENVSRRNQEIQKEQRRNAELMLSLENAENVHDFVNKMGFIQTYCHQRYLKIYQKKLVYHGIMQVIYAVFYEDDYIYEMEYLKEKSEKFDINTDVRGFKLNCRMFIDGKDLDPSLNGYIVKENKNLYITELGEAVNDMMEDGFPTIVDVNFTANMESLLDGVEEGNVNWKTVVRNFYPDLDEAVKAAQKALEKVKIEDEVTDVICDVCGRNMVVKYGPHGKFLACPGFPECRNTKPYYEKIGVACPKCGKDVVLKKTQKGRKYYGCIDNPECDFMSWQKPSNKKCPVCGSYMVEKGNKLVCSQETCGYVEQKEKEED